MQLCPMEFFYTMAGGTNDLVVIFAARIINLQKLQSIYSSYSPYSGLHYMKLKFMHVLSTFCDNLVPLIDFF